MSNALFCSFCLHKPAQYRFSGTVSGTEVPVCSKICASLLCRRHGSSKATGNGGGGGGKGIPGVRAAGDRFDDVAYDIERLKELGREYMRTANTWQEYARVYEATARQVSAERDTLAPLAARAQEAELQATQFKAQLAECAAAYRQISEELVRAQQYGKNMSSTIHQLQFDIAQLQREKDEAVDKLLQASYSDLRADVEREEKYKEREAEFERTHANDTATIEQLTKERTAYAKQAADANSSVIAQLRQQIETLEQAKTDAERSHQFDLEKWTGEFKDAQEKMRLLNEKVVMLEQEKQRLKVTVARQQVLVQRLEQTRLAYDKISQRLKAEQNAGSALVASNLRLKQQLDAANDKLKETEAERDRMAQVANSVNQEIAKLSAKMTSDFKENLEALTRSNDQMSVAMARMQAIRLERDEARVQLAVLQTQYRLAIQRLGGFAPQIDDAAAASASPPPAPSSSSTVLTQEQEEQLRARALSEFAEKTAEQRQEAYISLHRRIVLLEMQISAYEQLTRELELITRQRHDAVEEARRSNEALQLAQKRLQETTEQLYQIAAQKQDSELRLAAIKAELQNVINAVLPLTLTQVELAHYAKSPDERTKQNREALNELKEVLKILAT